MTKEIAPKTAINTPAVAGAVGRGFSSNLSAKDFLIPRIELTHPLTPCVIAGQAKAGTFINSVTKELITITNVIPVRFEKNFIRWFPREHGGGIMYRTLNAEDPRVKDDIKWANNEKPLCTEYINVLCLLESDLDMPIVAPFSRTSYQAGRKFYTLAIQQFGQDVWISKYKLTPALKTNKFSTFYVFEVNKIGPSTEEERAKAEQMYQTFTRFEELQVEYESESEEPKPATNKAEF